MSEPMCMSSYTSANKSRASIIRNRNISSNTRHIVIYHSDTQPYSMIRPDKNGHAVQELFTVYYRAVHQRYPHKARLIKADSDIKI